MQIQYKPKRSLWGTIFQVEILKGLSLTLSKLFSRSITRQYPQEKPNIRLGFRGQNALVRDAKTGRSKCVGCMRCATVCPSRCIRIRCHDDEQTGAKVVDTYEIEALRCVFCGFCVEVCPVNALVLTEVFEYAAYDREAIYFDQQRLLANWDSFAEQKGEAIAAYVNPFWRPRGMPAKMLTAAQRLEVPEEWTVKGQYVGSKYTRQQSAKTFTQV